MTKKSVYFFIVIIFILTTGLIMIGREGTTGNISVNITEGNTEITAMGGTSNVHVVSGCKEGSGIRKSEKRNVSSFDSVHLDGAFDVVIELQKKRGLEVSGDNNIIPHITTEVKGNRLHVTTNESICSKMELRVYIANNNVKEITSDGSSDIAVSGVKNRALTVSINGAGDFKASGSTGAFDARVSGSGNLDARKLHADEVTISIDGAGDADVYASKKLTASIDGSGDITYFGDPKEVTRSISGAGDIEKGNE